MLRREKQTDCKRLRVRERTRGMLKVVSKSSATAYRKSDGMRFGRQNSKIAEQGNTDQNV